jgi:glycosyltransferase involved in cell wall biosynthesis
MDILTISPNGIYPPYDGGALRVFNLCKELSKKHKIFLFSQGLRQHEINRIWQLKKQPELRVNDYFTEYRYINFTSIISHQILKKAVKNIPDLFIGKTLELFRPKALTERLLNSSVIQVEMPWQFDAIYKLKPEHTPIILDQHDLQFELLYQNICQDSDFGRKCIKYALRIERNALENADAVFVMSEENKETVIKHNKCSRSKIHVIPNGVDIDLYTLTPNSEKIKYKEILGIHGKYVILFTGSKHPPNIQAVNEIIKMAKNCKNKDILFLVGGSIGDLYTNQDNLQFTGHTEDISKLFKAADVAINPMISGGGTNLKMLEYLAAGLPTITTKIGARGLGIIDNQTAIISEIDEFLDHIELLKSDRELSDNLCHYGREWVEENYDWREIAEKQNKIMKSLI